MNRDKKKATHDKETPDYLDGAGFSIIEVLIALLVLSVGMLGMASLQGTSATGNMRGRDVTQATMLAQSRLDTLMRLDWADPELADIDQNEGWTGLDDVGPNAEHNATQSRYSIFWNIEDDLHINNTKVIGVVVTWSVKGNDKNVSLIQVKPRIL